MKAIIWRKSIYENNYICRCGEKLMEDNVLNVNEDCGYVICPKCKWLVAKLSTVDEAIKSGAMRDYEA